MRQFLARSILRGQLRRLSSDSHPFNRLMADAIQLQLGRLGDDAFRQRLDAFYQSLDIESIKRDLDLPVKAARLDKPGGYKTDISAIGPKPNSQSKPGRFDFWARRFGLLRHIGVRSDVLILRQDERIPPHGHHRVVSGFYVLQGEVAIRHYDRVKELENGLLVRKVLDTTLGPGGYTTNSESFHNIHWLQGLADKSFLFRVTVVDTPSANVPRDDHSNPRLYIDPTGEPDSSGIVTAPFISEAQAKSLTIAPVQAA
jgi:hypothetical protein